MPSPLELACDPVSICLFMLYAGMLAWEALRPARPLPRVHGWWWRAGASFAVYFLVSSYLPLWVADLISPIRVWDASALGLAGAAGAFALYQLLVYAYHRAIHRSDVLFRVFHQVHHSAERHDALGAFWFSPFDMVGFTTLSTLALGLVGLTPEATTLFVLGGTLLSIFQHLNVRTPRWLGYLVQRPESHAHHHARGLHRDNYADLPVIDMLFGTFVNPAQFAQQQGYYDGASARVLDMLCCRDVSSRPSLLLARDHGAP